MPNIYSENDREYFLSSAYKYYSDILSDDEPKGERQKGKHAFTVIRFKVRSLKDLRSKSSKYSLHKDFEGFDLKTNTIISK